jgi:hypothetical protein
MISSSASSTTHPGLDEESCSKPGSLQSSDIGQFYHNAKGAIAWLKERETGEAVGAIHHPAAGDLDAALPSSALRRPRRPLSVDKTPSNPSKANSAAMKYLRELAGTHKATIIQRVWEIQVASLLKIDRAAKSETSDGSQRVVPR